jgi:hypothetical protein
MRRGMTARTAGADKQDDDQKEGLEVEEADWGVFRTLSGPTGRVRLLTYHARMWLEYGWNVAWASSAGISRSFGIRRFGGILATIYSPISESPPPSSLPRQPKCPPPLRCHLILLPQNS